MSSFSYLRNLPIDFLKIDGAFIRNLNTDPIDFAMVATIHRIGGIMGVHTIAESVENESALAALALIGVDFAQAFISAGRCPSSSCGWPCSAVSPCRR